MLCRWPTGSDSHSPEHCFSPSPGQPLPWWPVQILSTRWVFPTSANKDNNSFQPSRFFFFLKSSFTQKTHCQWCYRVHGYICIIKERIQFSGLTHTLDTTLVYPLTAHHLIWRLYMLCELIIYCLQLPEGNSSGSLRFVYPSQVPWSPEFCCCDIIVRPWLVTRWLPWLDSGPNCAAWITGWALL